MEDVLASDCTLADLLGAFVSSNGVVLLSAIPIIKDLEMGLI